MTMHGAEGIGAASTYKPSLPFPITCLSTKSYRRYMLYDIDLVSWLRREHHILGVLVGTLPQAPSQNVFLGLPLELMPEEAQLLVEKDLAFIVDDRDWHLKSLRDGVSTAKFERYQTEIAQRGVDATNAIQNVKISRIEEAMERLNLSEGLQQRLKQKSTAREPEVLTTKADSLFGGHSEASAINDVPHAVPDTYAVTMTNSGALCSDEQSHKVHGSDPSSYALFKMLHNKGYFLSPGLRFGCQYMAYPGDPLRYHSHFLAVSSDWDKPINLIDIVGSGRLATGVKKSFLLGGIEPVESDAKQSPARAFSIEWAGM